MGEVRTVPRAVDDEPARGCLRFTNLADRMQRPRGADAVRRRGADPAGATTGVGDDRLTAAPKSEAVWSRPGRHGVMQGGQPSVRAHVERVDAAAHLLG